MEALMRMDFMDSDLGEYDVLVTSGYAAIASREFGDAYGYVESKDVTEIKVDPGTYRVSVEFSGYPKGPVNVEGDISTDRSILIGDPYKIATRSFWTRLLHDTSILTELPREECIAQHLGWYDTVVANVHVKKL